MNEKSERLPKPRTIVECFEGLPDPRMDRTRRHKFVLLPVIFLYFFAEVHAAISVSLLTSMVDATSRALANVRPLLVGILSIRSRFQTTNEHQWTRIRAAGTPSRAPAGWHSCSLFSLGVGIAIGLGIDLFRRGKHG